MLPGCEQKKCCRAHRGVRNRTPGGTLTSLPTTTCSKLTSRRYLPSGERTSGRRLEARGGLLHVDLKFHVRGCEARGFGELRLGLLELILRAQRDAEKVVELRVVGLQADGRARLGLRVGRLPQLEQVVREEPVVGRAVGLDAYGLAPLWLGVGVLFFQFERAGQAHVGDEC